jgi:hypothetical protein
MKSSNSSAAVLAVELVTVCASSLALGLTRPDKSSRGKWAALRFVEMNIEILDDLLRGSQQGLHDYESCTPRKRRCSEADAVQ